MSFCHYHCLDAFNETSFRQSIVARAFAIENTLPIDALVPGMAKENSKMICLFSLTKCLHFAQIRNLRTIFQQL
jgi:hypothetical protein